MFDTLLRLPSAKSSEVGSHLKVMPAWWKNGYLTSARDHCAEEMNVNAFSHMALNIGECQEFEVHILQLF